MNTVISFSCPTHLAMRLNDEKIGSRKKSEWISEAIRAKLDSKVAIFAHSKREILSRSISILNGENPALAKLLQEHLKSNYPKDN